MAINPEVNELTCVLKNGVITTSSIDLVSSDNYTPTAQGKLSIGRASFIAKFKLSFDDIINKYSDFLTKSTVSETLKKNEYYLYYDNFIQELEYYGVTTIDESTKKFTPLYSAKTIAIMPSTVYASLLYTLLNSFKTGVTLNDLIEAYGFEKLLYDLVELFNSVSNGYGFNLIAFSENGSEEWIDLPNRRLIITHYNNMLWSNAGNNMKLQLNSTQGDIPFVFNNTYNVGQTGANRSPTTDIKYYGYTATLTPIQF